MDLLRLWFVMFSPSSVIQGYSLPVLMYHYYVPTNTNSEDQMVIVELYDLD